MLKDGTIERSFVASSNIKDKDGYHRFCADYRILSHSKTRYPLNQDRFRIQKIIFLSMDMQSGLWQIEMKPESKEKTAFLAPDGNWQGKEM